MDDHRSFVIRDAMFLIAALAIGLAWVISDIRLVDRYQWKKLGGPILTWLDDRIPFMLAPLTIAVVAARVRPPLPSHRRLCREPGFVACGSATFVLLSTAATGLLFGLAQGAELSWIVRIYKSYWMPTVGPAVLGSWLLLIASGRWRSKSSWVDRLGRCLGLLWIVTRFGPLAFYYWDRLPKVLPPPP